MLFKGNRFSRQVIIIVINFALTVMGGCSKLVSPLAWQATPINVDGKLNDWKLPLPEYDMKTKLNYSITNDAQNLYICVKATDDESQTKILRGGMYVWIDTSGKEKHLAGIEFPMQQIRTHTSGGEQQHTQSGNSEKPNPAAMRHRLMTEQTQMQLSGFKDTNNGISPLHNADGITVALGWDSTGILIYEACIPFKTFYRDDISSVNEIKKPWSIGILLTGVAGAGGNRSGGRGGGMGGGMGGGGMHGGGMGGGGMRGGGGGMRGGGSGAENSTLSENQSIWEYVKPTLKHP